MSQKIQSDLKSAPFRIQTVDGVWIKGVVFTPLTPPKAVVLINPATGAKQSFYRPFGEYLVKNGFAVCLWDYRGMGESAPESLVDCNYWMHDFGLKDIPRVLSHLKESFPELAVLVVGHSVGAQLMGLVPNNDLVRGLVAVATSVGYAPYMPLSYRMKAKYFLNIFGPISIRLQGYVAAKKFGMMEDLPKNIFQEWKEWSAEPDYFFDSKFFGNTIPKGNYTSLNFPIQVISATDDPISNEKAVQRFWSHVISKEGIWFKIYRPEELKAKKIDHFGFFRKAFEPTIWADIAQHLHVFNQK